MGALLIDSSTKGFVGLTAIAASDQRAANVDPGEVSPALAKLLDALNEQGTDGGPVEVVIGVFGKHQHVFSVTLEDLSEIQEILQWTIGRE